MEGGTLAIAVLLIAGCIVFIIWARTAAGKHTLRNTLGEPGGSRHRMRVSKKRAATGGKTVRSGKSSSR